MRNITRTYKTEKGYFANCSSHSMRLQDFFSGKQLAGYKGENITLWKIPSKELKEKIADRFIERNFGRRNKADKERIKNALVENRCDLSYLQVFYTDGSNGLSGDAYDYCKRMFLRSIY